MGASILDQRLLLPLPEACIQLDVSRATLTRWSQQGRIRMVHVGRRAYIPVSEVERIAAGK